MITGDCSEISDDDGADTNNIVEDLNDTSWQKVKCAKRRRSSDSPKLHLHKRMTMNDEPSTSRNMYDLLQTNDDETIEINNSEHSEPKPPPIIIPDVADIKSMVNKFSKVIDSEEFSYKSYTDGQVRFMTKTAQSFRTLVKYLDEKQITFHTYQLKQERAYRIVVKNLHFSTPTDAIKSELERQGHKVRNIINAKSRVTKTPLSMFFVDLEPSANNMNVFQIRYLYNAVIKIEPPLKTDDIVQCHRCQQFGHTKSYCRRTYRCVKCGLNHPSNQCTKDKNIPPQCSNCLQDHTASYKGCSKYKELVQRKQIMRRQENAPKQPNFNNNAKNPSTANNNKYSDPHSYAGVAKSSLTQSDNSLRNIETLLNKQLELTNTLLNMMSLLMSKLCN